MEDWRPMETPPSELNQETSYRLPVEEPFIFPRSNRNLDLAQIPCRYTEMRGECPYGVSCPYSHAKTGMPGRSELVVELLDEKPLLPVGSRLEVHVVHIGNLGQFYVRPKYKPECVTKQFRRPLAPGTLRQEAEYRRVPGARYTDSQYLEFGYGDEAFEKLTDSMGKYFTNGKYRLHQDTSYASGELVAVRLAKDDLVWYRGVICEVNQYDYKFVVEVVLLDVGSQHCLELKLICHLPRKYCTYPPMVYTCCLQGAVPVSAWGDEHLHAEFKKMLDGRRVSMVVGKITERKEPTLVPDKYLYRVSLKLTDVTPQQDVLEQLSYKNLNLCLSVNKCPYRPEAQEIGPSEMMNFDRQLKKEHLLKLMEIEAKRIASLCRKQLNKMATNVNPQCSDLGDGFRTSNTSSESDSVDSKVEFRIKKSDEWNEKCNPHYPPKVCYYKFTEEMLSGNRIRRLTL